ncbi:winged helix-turn-helix domain-containing protein [Dyella solisilvae]|nr:winged helix-turn-helix domain-containing protein [Dyella solisilvae]
MAQIHADSGWIYHCDDIVVEPRAHRLERAGVALSVEPKAYSVLVVLLQQAGEVVGKDELLDAAWGHRHVTPSVLTRVISQLRRSLGDCAGSPRYIATVHSLGYRFIGDVRRIAAAPAPAPAEAPDAPDISPDQTTADTPTVPIPRPPAPVRWLAAAITLVMIVAVLAAMSLWHAPDAHLTSPRSSPRPALVFMPFAHASDPRPLHTRHWPRVHRVATEYGGSDDQLRADDDLPLRPDQAPVTRG